MSDSDDDVVVVCSKYNPPDPSSDSGSDDDTGEEQDNKPVEDPKKEFVLEPKDKEWIGRVRNTKEGWGVMLRKVPRYERVSKSPLKDEPCLTKKHFWEDFMSTFDSGKKVQGDNIVRNYGTMGAGWMYSVPYKREPTLLHKWVDYTYLYRNKAVLAQIASDPVFILFADIDLKDTVDIEPEYVFKMCGIIAETVAKCYPELLNHKDRFVQKKRPANTYNEELGEWVGAGEGFGRLTSMVEISFGKPGSHACGVHQRWIGMLRVTRAQACEMRLACIKALNNRLERKPPQNSWEEAFDAKPYGKGGGVRMLGSSKLTLCPQCYGKGEAGENDPRNNPLGGASRADPTIQPFDQGTRSFIDKHRQCTVCHGKKTVQELKYYSPKWILDGTGHIDNDLSWVLDDPREFVFASSIRTRVFEPMSEYVGPCDPTLVDPELEKQAMKKLGIKSNPPKGKGTNMEELRTGQHYETVSTEVRLVLELLMDMDHGGHWQGLRINHFYRRSKKYYIVKVVANSPGSHYCLKKGGTREKSIKIPMILEIYVCIAGDHSNHIYFEVWQDGVRQKCYSDNQECRGPSPMIPLPVGLKAMLFNEASKDAIMHIFQKESERSMYTAISPKSTTTAAALGEDITSREKRLAKEYGPFPTSTEPCGAKNLGLRKTLCSIMANLMDLKSPEEKRKILAEEADDENRSRPTKRRRRRKNPNPTSDGATKAASIPVVGGIQFGEDVRSRR